ncbi:unnamed protein product, partial [Sphenostylis stenocarpa]
MSSARIARPEPTFGPKTRAAPASDSLISKITLKVVVFHFRRFQPHLSYTSQVISQSLTRVKLNRSSFPPIPPSPFPWPWFRRIVDSD